MKPKIHTLIIAVVLLPALLAPAAAAQAETQTPTSTPGASESVALVIDEDVSLVSYDYADGEMILRLRSDEYKPVYVSPMPETTAETGTNDAGASHVVDAGTVTTVRVRATGVTITTDDKAPGFAWVQKPSSSLIAGPYTGTDVRDAGIGSAVAVAFAVLFTAVKAKVSGGKRGERVA
jgi:hypothetical protein